ncbi:MAG TPA: SRPBCC family protein [Gemmatimonadota bacterium]|nr:SRPBCC family protein [Gemmatimonadota bacterium]
MHIERFTTMRVPVEPAEALPLFTPEGERAWVAGWDPEPVHAPGGSLSREGAVFRTTHGGEETVWLVQRVDASQGAADYVRITPGNRLGTVHVRCTDDGEGGSNVEVGYRLTALSPAGEEALDAITPEAFEADIRGWQAAIEGLLAER